MRDFDSIRKDLEEMCTLNHCAVNTILTAIKRNGIEKTLEDLQHAMGNSMSMFPEAGENIYQSFLKTLEKVTATAEGAKRILDDVEKEDWEGEI